MAEHRKTITALAWHPKNSDLFATSGTDNRIIVWHVSEQRIAYSLEGTRATPTSLSWSMVDDNILTFCSGRGPLLVWNMQQASSINPHKEAANFGSEVTLVRWHHKQVGKLVTGHLNGSLSFFTVGEYLKGMEVR